MGQTTGTKSLVSATLGLFFWMLLSMQLQGAGNTSLSWKELNSAADVCKSRPGMVKALFDALDLEQPGLAPVKAAYADGDMVKASELLLAYYRDGKSSPWLRKIPAPRSETKDEKAEAMRQDTYTFYGETMRVPRRKDGGLDWMCSGPSHDREWRMALNRHHHLRVLLNAYLATGNRAYARALDEQIRDWSLAIEFPTRERDAWGTNLDTSFRAKAWSRVFFALQQEGVFTPAARLLLLTRLPEHLTRLKKYHHSNWGTMELSGLAAITTAFPEFRGATELTSFALRSLNAELGRQVYPDGVQKELTSGYHWVALTSFDQLAVICRDAGVAVPETYSQGMERMWNYLAYSMRPNGRGALNNDSDLKENASRVLKAADQYERPDWTWIATNGKAGKAPEGPPSTVFPWAGQVIMRSAWDAEAQWAFFDIGPYGTAHQHEDMLHLSVHAFGRDLLVDAGRFAYSGKMGGYRSGYGMLSQAHNVILIDGQGQGAGPYEAKQSLAIDTYAITPELDFAMGTFKGFKKVAGQAEHTRAVLYLRGGYWLVIDRIATDRPRKLSALWHFHPACTVKQDGATVVSTDEGLGNLRVAPVGGPAWEVTLIKGQTKPDLQGWYSETYGKLGDPEGAG